MILNAKTYKSKLIILVIVSIVSFILIYRLAFNKTIHLINTHNKNKSEIALIENAPLKLARLNKELSEISNVILGDSSSTEDLRQKLFDETTGFCINNGILFVEMPDPVTYHKTEYSIITHTIVLSGSFKDLLKYIYYLEQESNFIKIVSANLSLEKPNRRTGKKELYLRMYFQNIEEQ